MNKAKLQDISTKIGSGATPRGGKDAYKTEGISLIRSMNVYDSHFTTKNLAYIDDSQAQALSNVVVQKNDILLNITGASVARCCMVPKTVLPARVNQHVAIIRVDSKLVDPRFVFLSLVSPKYKSKLLSLAQGGATREALTKSTIENFDVELPELKVQSDVADAVITYDNLIENNNRRIAILEEMAQSLYREWFVKFRFPGHQQAKFIDSPLGKIPEGWEIKKLSELTTKIGSGATPKGGKGAYKAEGLSLIRSLNVFDGQFKLKNLAFIDDQQAGKLSNVVVEKNDVLLNITGASVARCCIVPSFVLPARVNQHVAIIRANENKISPFYIYNYLTSQQGKGRLLSLAQGGATREALTKITIENFEIVVPPSELLRSYVALAIKSNLLKEVLEHKNNNLKKQRDALLPKLISEQIGLQ